MAEDTEDLYLSAAVMCCFAVPVVGALGAVIPSTLRALHDADTENMNAIGVHFSITDAISQLNEKITASMKNYVETDDLHQVETWMQDADKIFGSAFDGNLQLSTATSDADRFFLDKQFDHVLNTILAYTGADLINNIKLYMSARTAYHSECIAYLTGLAAGLGSKKPGDDWVLVDNRIRWHILLKSLDHSKTCHDPNKLKIVKAIDDLDKAYQYMASGALQTQANDAHPTTVNPVPAKIVRARQATFTSLLRAYRKANHTDLSNPAQVQHWKDFLSAFDYLRGKIEGADVTLTVPADGEAPGQTSTKKPAVINLPPLKPGKLVDPKAPGSIRFMYECTKGRTYVPVLSNSAVAQGNLVSQNAGSTNAGLYYDVGGGFLNGEFKQSLVASGELGTVTKSLHAAYDKKYGSGSYNTDSAASSPRQDRLTSLFVPLSPGTGKTGVSVYGMMYSVGPRLQSQSGITDTDQYKQIYTDALNAIAAVNKQYPNIALKCFRITLLSTGAYSGNANINTLIQQAAGLIVDAVVAAAKLDSSLQDLTILINTDDTGGASAREAFDAVATSRKVTPIGEGFDIPLV